ncbi:MAG: lysophospholipid acyltransferase family protein [Bacteroidales bacterium]|nr:lysophospholipid acyltransferase family protein [Bacteroidales bacterium]
MKYFLFTISTAGMRLLALLPPFMLYLTADLLSFVLRHLVRYRKNTITLNLKNAFPEHTDKEIAAIRNKFYRHLADLIVENVVIPFYPRKRLEHMFRFADTELLHRYFNLQRNIIVITGHYNNWEWGAPFSYTFDYKIVGVYKPLHNKYFDQLYLTARSRFGAHVVPMDTIARVLFDYRQLGIPTLTGMVGDQRPGRKRIRYWTMFMNQHTAVFTGTEKIAKKIDAVVVFMKIRKTRRGVYTADFELVTDTSASTAPNEITEKHTRILEKLILEEPAYWLWSHNRWKLSYEEWLKSDKKASVPGKQ